MEEITRGSSVPPKKRRPSLLVRFLAFLLTLALVAGAVAAVVYRDKLNFDAIKRYFTYRSLERGESGQAESFTYDGGTDSCFATVDGDLLVCSTSGVRLYSGSGQLYVDKTLVLEHPAVDAAGKVFLAYDTGGTHLFVFSDREEVFSLTLEEDQAILAASVNEAGWLTVVTQQSGFKGVVTVYDASYNEVMGVSLSSRFVMDAVLSPNSKAVAILTMGAEENAFDSRVDIYQLDHSEENADADYACSLGSTTVLDLRWDEDGIWALGENAVARMDSQGTLLGSYDYAGRYLKAFSLDGNGTAALLLGKYRAGSTAQLIVTDEQGQERAVLPIEEQVLSLSAAGRYIALLTADRLDIYDQDLELYHTMEGTQGTRRVIQRADGSAMLIGSDTARLYLPE